MNNERIEQLWGSLTNANIGFTRTLDEFKIDMQDENNRKQLWGNLPKVDSGFTRTWDEFNNDMGFVLDSAEESKQIQSVQQEPLQITQISPEELAKQNILAAQEEASKENIVLSDEQQARLKKNQEALAQQEEQRMAAFTGFTTGEQNIRNLIQQQKNEDRYNFTQSARGKQLIADSEALLQGMSDEYEKDAKAIAQKYLPKLESAKSKEEQTKVLDQYEAENKARFVKYEKEFTTKKDELQTSLDATADEEANKMTAEQYQKLIGNVQRREDVYSTKLIQDEIRKQRAEQRKNENAIQSIVNDVTYSLFAGDAHLINSTIGIVNSLANLAGHSNVEWKTLKDAETYYTAMADRYNEQKGIVDYAEEGKLDKAAFTLASQVLYNTPNTVTSLFFGALNLAKTGGTVLGATAAYDKYQEIKDRDDISDLTKAANVAGAFFAECLPETLSSARYAKMYHNQPVSDIRTGLVKQMTGKFGDFIRKMGNTKVGGALGKSFDWFLKWFGEGATEWLTEIANQTIDEALGTADPQLTDHAKRNARIDALLVGMFSDTHGAVMNIHNTVKFYNDRKEFKHRIESSPIDTEICKELNVSPSTLANIAANQKYGESLNGKEKDVLKAFAEKRKPYDNQITNTRNLFANTGIAYPTQDDEIRFNQNVNLLSNMLGKSGAELNTLLKKSASEMTKSEQEFMNDLQAALHTAYNNVSFKTNTEGDTTTYTFEQRELTKNGKTRKVKNGGAQIGLNEIIATVEGEQELNADSPIILHSITTNGQIFAAKVIQDGVERNVQISPETFNRLTGERFVPTQQMSTEQIQETQQPVQQTEQAQVEEQWEQKSVPMKEQTINITLNGQETAVTVNGTAMVNPNGTIDFGNSDLQIRDFNDNPISKKDMEAYETAINDALRKDEIPQQTQQQTQQPVVSEKTKKEIELAQFIADQLKNVPQGTSIKSMTTKQRFANAVNKFGLDAALQASQENVVRLQEEIANLANKKMDAFEKQEQMVQLQQELADNQEMIDKFAPKQEAAPAPIQTPEHAPTKQVKTEKKSAKKEKTAEELAAEEAAKEAREEERKRKAAERKAAEEEAKRKAAEEAERKRIAAIDGIIKNASDEMTTLGISSEEAANYIRDFLNGDTTKSLKQFTDKFLYGKLSITDALKVLNTIDTNINENFLRKQTKFKEVTPNTFNVMQDNDILIGYKQTTSGFKWFACRKIGDEIEWLSGQPINAKTKKGSRYAIGEGIGIFDNKKKAFAWELMYDASGKYIGSRPVLVLNYGHLKGNIKKTEEIKNPSHYVMLADGNVVKADNNNLRVEASESSKHYIPTAEEKQTVKTEAENKKFVDLLNKMKSATDMFEQQPLEGIRLFDAIQYNKKGSRYDVFSLDESELKSDERLDKMTITDLQKQLTDFIDKWNAVMDKYNYDQFLSGKGATTLKIDKAKLKTKDGKKATTKMDILKSDAMTDLFNAVKTINNWHQLDNPKMKDVVKQENEINKQQKEKNAQKISASEKNSVSLQPKVSEEDRKKRIKIRSLFNKNTVSNLRVSLPLYLDERQQFISSIINPSDFGNRILIVKNFKEYLEQLKIHRKDIWENVHEKIEALPDNTAGIELFGTFILNTSGVNNLEELYRLVFHEPQHILFRSYKGGKINLSEEEQRNIIAAVNGTNYYDKVITPSDFTQEQLDARKSKYGDFFYQGLVLKNEFLSHMMEVCALADYLNVEKTNLLEQLGITDKETIDTILDVYSNQTKNFNYNNLYSYANNQHGRLSFREGAERLRESNSRNDRGAEEIIYYDTIQDVFDNGTSQLDNPEFVQSLNNAQKKDANTLGGPNPSVIASIGVDVNPSVISRRTSEQVNAWLVKRRPELDADQRATVIDWLEQSFDDTNTQLSAGWWFANGNVRIGEDDEKIKQAVQIAKNHNVQASRFSTPAEVMEAYVRPNEGVEPIDPNTVPTLHKVDLDWIPKDMEVFDVDDSEESQDNMRKIVNTHFGVDANPWCLLQARDGKLTQSARNYWNQYGGRYRVAFQNGKLIAFMSRANGYQWWDRRDHSHYGIPHLEKLEGKKKQYSYIQGIEADKIEKGPIFEGDPYEGHYIEYAEDGKTIVLEQTLHKGKLNGVLKINDLSGNTMYEVKAHTVESLIPANINQETGEEIEPEKIVIDEEIDYVKIPYLIDKVKGGIYTPQNTNEISMSHSQWGQGNTIFIYSKNQDGERSYIRMNTDDVFHIEEVKYEEPDSNNEITILYGRSGESIRETLDNKSKEIKTLYDRYGNIISSSYNDLNTGYQRIVRYKNGEIYNRDTRFGFGNHKVSESFDNGKPVFTEVVYKGDILQLHFNENGEIFQRNKHADNGYGSVSMSEQRYIKEGTMIRQIISNTDYSEVFADYDVNGKLVNMDYKVGETGEVLPLTASEIVDRNPDFEGFVDDDGIQFSIIAPKEILDFGVYNNKSERTSDILVAEAMERAGEDEGTIQIATGLVRGTDNVWYDSAVDEEQAEKIVEKYAEDLRNSEKNSTFAVNITQNAGGEYIENRISEINETNRIAYKNALNTLRGIESENPNTGKPYTEQEAINAVIRIENGAKEQMKQLVNLAIAHIQGVNANVEGGVGVYIKNNNDVIEYTQRVVIDVDRSIYDTQEKEEKLYEDISSAMAKIAEVTRQDSYILNYPDNIKADGKTRAGAHRFRIDIDKPITPKEKAELANLFLLAKIGLTITDNNITSSVFEFDDFTNNEFDKITEYLLNYLKDGNAETKIPIARRFGELVQQRANEEDERVRDEMSSRIDELFSDDLSKIALHENYVSSYNEAKDISKNGKEGTRDYSEIYGGKETSSPRSGIQEASIDDLQELYNETEVNFSIVNPRIVTSPAQVGEETRKRMEENAAKKMEVVDDPTAKLWSQTTAAYKKLVQDCADNTEAVRGFENWLNEQRRLHGTTPAERKPITARQSVRNGLDAMESAIAGATAIFENTQQKDLFNYLDGLSKVVEESDMYKKYKVDALQAGEKEAYVLTPLDFIERYLIARSNAEQFEIDPTKTRGEGAFAKRMGVDMATFANEFVKEFGENRVNTLWEKIRACTDYSLQMLHDSQVLDDEMFQSFMEREYYIPQKGYAEKDINPDMYIQKVGGKYSLKKPTSVSYKREGGESLAGHVLSYMIYDVNNSIKTAKMNDVRLKMYDLLMQNQQYLTPFGINRPAKVYTVKKKDANGNFIKDEEGNYILEDVAALTQEEEDAYMLAKNAIKQLRDMKDVTTDKARRKEIQNEINEIKDNMYVASTRSNRDRLRTQAELNQTKVDVWVDGELHQMDLRGMEDIANALNGVRNTEGAFGGFIKSASGTLSSFCTTYNPTFFVVNIVRDIPYIAVKGAIEYGGLFDAHFMREMLPASGTTKTIHNWIWNGQFDMESENGRMLHDFIMNGGATGYNHVDDVQKLKDKMEAAMHDSKVLNGLGQFAKGLNEYSELLTRFAAYKAVLKMGYSEAEAIKAAKNLSVNFNRKGQGNTFLNTFNNLSMFTNAAIQGASGFYRSFAAKNGEEKWKRAAKALTMFSAIPAAFGFFTTLLTMDSDDDEKEIDKFYRDNFICFGDYRIPLNEQIKPFWVIGVNIALAMHGKRNAGEMADSIISTLLTNLVPLPPALTKVGTMLSNKFIGDEELSMADIVQRTLTPQALATVNNLAENKDFMDNKLYKDNVGDIPQYKLAEQEAAFYKDVAYAFYRMSGGDKNRDSKYRKGDMTKEIWADVNPREIKAWLSPLPSGWLDAICGVYGLGKWTIAGENELRWKDFPVANKFYRPTQNQEQFYRYNLYKEASEIVKNFDESANTIKKQYASGNDKAVDAAKQLVNDYYEQGYNIQIMKKYLEAYKKSSLYSLAKAQGMSEKEYRLKYDLPDHTPMDEIQKIAAQGLKLCMYQHYGTPKSVDLEENFWRVREK